MTEAATLDDAPVFKLDRFVVPFESVAAFVDRLHRINQALGMLPGCRRHLVLSQDGSDGEVRLATLVEWTNARTLAAARLSMQQAFADEGFDPAEFMRALGVREEMGLYRVA